MPEPLVNELHRRYPACWAYSRIGKGIDLMITGLPTITFHKRGKDRLTVRVGRVVLYRDQSFDRVPDLVIALVWREYTNYLRHDKTPDVAPPAILRSEIEGVAMNLATLAADALHPERPTVADEALMGVVATLRHALAEIAKENT